MGSFVAFAALLGEIEDPRRAEGKLYRLPHVVLFAILAIVSGANSYRTIHTFIDVHLARLRDAFGLKWRKAPAYTTIRGILRQLDPSSVEAAFRRYAASLNNAAASHGQRHVAIDGKALRRSFDNFCDRRAAHLLSAFASHTALVLAHMDCDDKSNEIPAAQALLGAVTDRRDGHGRCHALSKKAFEQAAASGVHLIAQERHSTKADAERATKTLQSRDAAAAHGTAKVRARWWQPRNGIATMGYVSTRKIGSVSEIFVRKL